MSEQPRGRVPEFRAAYTDADGDTFTAILGREGAPGVVADFSMAQCGLSGIGPGDLIVVTPESVRLLELPPWTKEQLDEITRRARERAAEFAKFCD